MLRCTRLRLLLLGAVAACGDATLYTGAVELRLPTAADCRAPQPPTEVIVEALGDFPPSDERTIEVFRPGPEPGIIDRFPFATEALAVRARSGSWVGFGLLLLDGRGDLQAPLLLLPPLIPCPVADPALRDEGGAVVPLSDGGLVWFGGREGDGRATRRVVHWEPSTPLANVVDPGLQSPRLDAAAVHVGDEVWVMGGALGALGPAHDTMEVYSSTTRSVGERLVTLREPRRGAGAARLPDGRVLLVGGRGSGEGPPLDSAELIEPSTMTSTPTSALPRERDAPLVRVLDDGTTLILGGTLLGGSPATEVLAFDPRSTSFIALGVVLDGKVREAVPLPGGRLAVLAGDILTELTILRNAPPVLGPVPTLETWTFAFDGPPLTMGAATALRDGTLLLAGRDPDNLRHMVRIDVGAATAEPLAAPRALERLVTLADGVVAAIDTVGMELQRIVERSPFDHAPASLLAEDLALDAPGRWRTEGAALIATVDDARADLAGLRFAAVAIDIESSGSVEVLIQPEMSPPQSVRIDDRRVGPALCEIESAEGVTHLERRGRTLVIERGGHTQACRLDRVEGRVALAFRARANGSFERITVQRLADR